MKIKVFLRDGGDYSAFNDFCYFLQYIDLSMKWLWKQCGFLMPPQPLTTFEIQKYYENEPRFNGVYSRDNLSKIKDGHI